MFVLDLALSTILLTFLSLLLNNVMALTITSMKITAIETIYLPKGVTVHVGAIQYLWVRIHTDEGLIGLGESYPNAEAEAAIVHTRLAPVLLGRDPSEIDRLWADMFLAVSYSGWAGAEMRAISAVDIALWDLLGKATGQPMYKLLGGASRQSIRIYNTCYDRVDFLREPVQLARELLNSNIRAMKIWPFDPIAKETGGNYISAEQMKRAIEPLALIREEFGDTIDVAMEFHGFWNLPSAIKIAAALKPYQPMWLEEMLPQDNPAAYAELARSTRSAALPERTPDDALGISRGSGKPCRSNHHARHLLVRGHLRSKEDRHDGGDLLSSHRPAQLRRPYIAFCIGASGGERDQPVHS